MKIQITKNKLQTNNKFKILKSKYSMVLNFGHWNFEFIWNLRFGAWNFRRRRAGFTLIELIIYLAIVGIILTVISYLMLDILGGQVSSYADQEVNQNIRFITNIMTKDMKEAQDIGSLNSDTLLLTMSDDDITYNLDGGTSALTRQIGSGDVINIHSNKLEVTGGFTDLSRLGRTKNIGINLLVNFKNPDNLTDYNSSTTINFAVELQGRK